MNNFAKLIRRIVLFPMLERNYKISFVLNKRLNHFRVDSCKMKVVKGKQMLGSWIRHCLHAK